jgi:hypothetical protein
MGYRRLHAFTASNAAAMCSIVVILGMVTASSNIVATTFAHPKCWPGLEGRVVDRGGRPIPGARIYFDGDLSSRDRDRPWTNADGTYRLAVQTICPTPEPLTVTVQAKGYQPKAETRERSGDGRFRFEHVLERLQE